MTAHWRLQEALRSGRNMICAGIIEGPGGAYCDFSDSKDWSEGEIASMERLLAEANAAEVYRKALEPMARAYAARCLMFGEEPPAGKEWKEAMAEACRLMGIESEEEQR